MGTQKDFLGKTGYLYSKKTDEAWSSLHKKIEQDGVPEMKPVFYSSWTVRIAAVLILLLGLVWGIRSIVNPGMEKIQTASSQRQVTLPDGSIAYLNSNSYLTYPIVFGKQVRKVTLSGEGFFKVTKNPLKPFIVETQSARIKVLGTSFNVLAPKGNNQVEVLVKTGIVSLSPINNSKDKLFLKKGDFGLMQAGKTKKAKAPGINYLSWQTKKFQFEDEKLINVIHVLNHAYAKRILLNTDSLEKLRLTSTYNQVSFETVIQSLCLTFHLKATHSGDEIILSSVNKLPKNK